MLAQSVKVFTRPIFVVKIQSIEGYPIDWDEIEVSGCNNATEARNNVLRHLPEGYRIVSVKQS
jgi:hypothetical protein